MFFEWIDDYFDRLEADKANKEFKAKEKALGDDGMIKHDPSRIAKKITKVLEEALLQGYLKSKQEKE